MTLSPATAPLSNFGMVRSLAGQPLGTAVAADEFLHAPAASGHYSATETSYFGFNVPEHALNGEIYVWFHPVLWIMSASVYIWRGIHASTLSCDYVNHYHFLPFPDHDIDDYRIEELGLHIRVLEPLRAVQIDCVDDQRGVPSLAALACDHAACGTSRWLSFHAGHAYRRYARSAGYAVHDRWLVFAGSFVGPGAPRDQSSHPAVHLDGRCGRR